jgi:hypothetical protein
VTKSAKHEFSLRAFWFVRGEVRSDELPIPFVAAWRRAVKPYRRRRSVALYLDRDHFESGGVWAHFTAERAWVVHYDCPGGPPTEARSSAGPGRLPRSIPFRLDNGQMDNVDRERTIPRAEGMRALEYFLLHGRVDPELRWVR